MKKNTRYKYDKKRAMLVQELANEFACSDVNVRKAINGYSVTEQSLQIVKVYNKKYAELSAVLTK